MFLAKNANDALHGEALAVPEHGDRATLAFGGLVGLPSVFHVPHLLHDWLHHPDGALVRPKDPLEYLQKLRFHRQVSSPAAYGLD